MSTLLSKDKLEEYILQSELFENNPIEITDILSEIDETEGLVNQIYRIRDSVTGKSFVIKQVLPYALGIARKTGEYFYMDSERILSESRALTFLETFWSGIAPVIYYMDKERGLLIMEDLTDYNNLRFELPKSHKYPSFALEIGALLGALRYYTSELYLDSDTCEELEDYFKNAYHRARMADMIMGKDNMTLHPEKFDLRVKEICISIGEDEEIQKKIQQLRDELVERPSCFCHMDLHIGNVLVLDDKIKLIDSEFSGYGTSYMDLGRIASSFLINFISWLYRESEDEKREEMLEYNKQMIYDLFTSYKITLEKLIPGQAQRIYRDEEKKSIRLMMLSTLLRMQSGIALSHDIAMIAPEIMDQAQRDVFKITRDVFKNDAMSNLDTIIERIEKLMKK